MASIACTDINVKDAYALLLKSLGKMMCGYHRYITGMFVQTVRIIRWPNSFLTITRSRGTVRPFMIAVIAILSKTRLYSSVVEREFHKLRVGSSILPRVITTVRPIN